MKRRDLIQYLQRNGCELLREGARHSIYKSIAGGSLTVVPRHREIKDLGLDHHLDHRVGWVERSETQHFVFVGFRSSTQPTFHALAEIMIKALFINNYASQLMSVFC